MRILMINNEYPPIGGGTGSVNEILLHELAEYPNLEIDLITSSGSSKSYNKQLSSTITLRFLALPRKDIHHASNLELIRFAWKSFWYARKMHREKSYDLIFAWCTVPAGATAWLLQWIYKIPYIVRVSGPDLPNYEKRYSLLVQLLRPLLRAVWRETAYTVCKSQFELSAVTSELPSAHVVQIPNGLTPSADAKKSYYAVQSPLRLISVGRLIERKRMDTLLHLVAELNKKGTTTTLDLIGDGDHRKELEQLAKKLRVDSSVNFHGYVNRQKIPGLLAASDLFLLATERDAMSVAVLEAIAAGVPVVVTQESGLDDLLVHEQNCLIFPCGDVDSATECVVRLTQDQKLRERFAVEALRSMEANTWSSVAERYADLFRKAVP